jgi:pilus assembly protein CpaB
MKQRIIPIVSILVGILAFVLTIIFIRGKQDEYNRKISDFYRNARQIQIVVAASDVPAGTALSKRDLGVKTVYEMGVSVKGQQVTIDDAEMLLGRKVMYAIAKNDPILWSDLEGGSSKDKLAFIVKPGLRAISISVGGASAVSSLVQPNDRIDVLGSFSLPSKQTPGEMETVTLTVLQDVSVLATGQDMANLRPSMRRQLRSSSYNTVTLEVTPREAELLVFAQQMRGRIVLSLRNPEDNSFEKDIPEVDFQKMEGQLQDLNDFRQKSIRHKRN